METRNSMGIGLHRWAFEIIMALSVAYLILAFAAQNFANSIDIYYAIAILSLSVIGARKR